MLILTLRKRIMRRQKKRKEKRKELTQLKVTEMTGSKDHFPGVHDKANGPLVRKATRADEPRSASKVHNATDGSLASRANRANESQSALKWSLTGKAKLVTSKLPVTANPLEADSELTSHSCPCNKASDRKL